MANVRTVASLGGETKILQDYIMQLLPALLSAKRASHWRGVVFGLSRSLFNFVIAASLYYGGTLIVYEKIEYEVVFKYVVLFNRSEILNFFKRVVIKRCTYN